ncbi:hypothetical protein MRB53_042021 [Persea americana]|nr:hypothetical protein MRB53_042021 [Persea americana]
MVESNAPLQEAIAMSINDGNGRIVRDTDMIRLDPHERTILLVCSIDGERASCSPRLPEQPKITECCYTRAGDWLEGGVLQPWRYPEYGDDENGESDTD